MTMLFSPRRSRLKIAMFRLQDVCVYVQEDLSSYIRTASLDRSPGIEATFRWLNKKGVEVALISDLDPATTTVLLQRLNWSIGKGELVQAVIYDLFESVNPFARAMEQRGIMQGDSVLTLADTPRLLKMAQDCKIYFNLGTTSGSNSYQVLRNAPHLALLDQPVQLANFLLTYQQNTWTNPDFPSESLDGEDFLLH
ncbi:hypothetical protein [Neolewinella agarilytica]|nr:hypothetical protein [Neolewinella agarilytica]